MKRYILTITISLIIVCFFGILGFSYFRVTKEKEMLMDDLNRRARIIAKSLAPAGMRFLKNPPAGDEEDLAERLAGQGRTMGILLCGVDGKIVARSLALSDIGNCEGFIAGDETGSGSENIEKVFLHEESGMTLHTLTYPLKDKNQNLIGTLTIVHEASYINERIRSLIAWTTLSFAILAFFISAMTYLISRRLFEKSIYKLLGWMKLEKDMATPPPTESLLKPVAREVEKLTARLRSARETAPAPSLAARREPTQGSAPDAAPRRPC